MEQDKNEKKMENNKSLNRWQQTFVNYRKMRLSFFVIRESPRECVTVYIHNAFRKCAQPFTFSTSYCLTAWFENRFNVDFVSLIYTQHPIISKWICVNRTLNEKLKCLESISIQPLCYTSLNKSGVNVCLTNHIISGMDSLCAIIVVNIIFEWLPHFCTPHIQLIVRPLKSSS